MKIIPALTALLFTASAGYADLVIEQSVESPVQNGTLTLKVKGDKVRVDMTAGPAGAISTVMDTATGDSVTMIHDRKMVMKIPGAQTRKAMEAMKSKAAQGSDAPTPAKVQSTGRTEKVGGYDTEIYTWDAHGMKQTLWVARDYPDYASFKTELQKINNSSAAGMAKGLTPDLAELPGMVVKSETETNGQKFTTSLVSLKKVPVDAALFEVPADYQEMGRPGAGGGEP
jgi:hypothetical protein